MTNKVYGYIRVSTREQNIERQLISLIEAGIDQKSIYIDKQSGKDFRRPAYKKMMRKVREGDLIVVKSIDRLGRNYQDIMEQWRIITKEKGADICIQGNTAYIDGCRRLRGAIVHAQELRGGAALVTAALAAEGTSIVTNRHYIDRGYEDLVLRLRELGAAIELA